MPDARSIKRRKPKLLVALLLLVVLFVLARCGPVMVSAEFSGVVVDAVTGQPVDGAAVVARWELQGLESSSLDTFAIEEGVTDSSGAFTIPGWGPRFNGRFLYANIRGSDPEIIVFKNGYQPVFRRNNASSRWFYLAAQQLDGQTISLLPFEGSMEEYVDVCKDIDSRIARQLYQPGCGWKRIPNLILELHSVGVDAAEVGIEGRSTLIDRIPQKDCEDPREYFKGYLQ